MATEEKLPAVLDALGTALSKASDLVSPEHYLEPHEKPQIMYMNVRQKELKGEKGRVIRQAGAFMIGKKDDLTYPDREELLVTILGYRPGRVYFKDLNSTKPDCKSDDLVHGSRPQETVNGKKVFGECSDCWLSQWGSGVDGKRQACGENRRLFIVDWDNQRPYVLTVGRSSLRTFAAYENLVTDQAKKLFKADAEGRYPSVHHLLAVMAKLTYKEKPAGHYVVEFVHRAEDGSLLSPVALDRKRQEMMFDLWQASMDQYKQAVRNQEYDAEDYAADRSGGADADDPGHQGE